MSKKINKIKGELIKFQAKDGLELNGFLIRSKRKNRNIILHVFGMNDDFFSSNIYWRLAEQIKGSKFDLFLPSNRGLAPLFIFKNNDRRTFLGTAREKFEDCIHDLGGTVEILENLGYRSIILQGHSTGCQKITYYQHKTLDSRVKALAILAPADDYNLARRRLGRKFNEAVAICKEMIKKQKGDELTPKWISYHTARRFLSYADLSNVEARLYNYDSDLKEFSEIRSPVLAVFGERDVHLTKPASEHMKILENNSDSPLFKWRIIKGADHNFTNKEVMLSRVILDWLGRTVR